MQIKSPKKTFRASFYNSYTARQCLDVHCSHCEFQFVLLQIQLMQESCIFVYIRMCWHASFHIDTISPSLAIHIKENQESMLAKSLSHVMYRESGSCVHVLPPPYVHWLFLTLTYVRRWQWQRYWICSGLLTCSI